MAKLVASKLLADGLEVVALVRRMLPVMGIASFRYRAVFLPLRCYPTLATSYGEFPGDPDYGSRML